MRSSLLVSVAVGLVLFGLSGLAFSLLYIGSHEPMVVYAAAFFGLVGFGATWVIELLTSNRAQ